MQVGFAEALAVQTDLFPLRGPLLSAFLDSSMVEHSAVNRRVVGSSPTRGVHVARCLRSRQSSRYTARPYREAIIMAERPLLRGSAKECRAGSHHYVVPPTNIWLRGQAVKTSPFHGGNTGSIPVGVSICSEVSSKMTEPLLHREHLSPTGDSHVRASIHGPVAQLVRAPPCHGGGHGFESRLGRTRTIAIQQGVSRMRVACGDGALHV